MATVASKALHEQLSLIMAALTKAAVAEICEVVDEGYGLLQLEISRRNQENEALRKKLHLIESIVIRGAGTNSGTGGGGAKGKAAEPEVVTAPSAEIAAGGGGGGAAAAPKEELPDVVLIKDEDSDSDDAFCEENRTFSEGGPAVRSARTSRTPKRPKTGNDDTENSSTSSTSSEHVSLKTPRLTSAPHKTAAATVVYTLESPRREPGCSGQAGAEETESLCSYSSQLDPAVQLVQQQDFSLVSPGSSRQTYVSSGSLVESPSNRVELDFGLPWTKQSRSSMGLAPFQQNENMDSDAYGLKLISVSGSASTDGPLSEHSDSAFEYEDVDMLSFYREQSGQPSGAGATTPSRGKRFVCPVCNKTYATAQNLDVHLRIHRGEKPFGCSQCSKKFTQSAHLKAHLSIHSGERPHACGLCPRSFIARYSLKLHVKKHHPEAAGEPAP